MIEIHNTSFRSLEEIKTWLDERNTEYRNGDSTVADEHYDEVWRFYKEKTGKQLHDGVVKFEKIENNKRENNPVPMAGLEKITDIKDFFKWIEKYNLFGEQLVCTPKFDGVSCGIINDEDDFKNNSCMRAYIKGDEGSYSIRNHYKHVKTSRDGQNHFDGFYHVGEIIMSNRIFEQKYSEKFKNVRNFTAGRLNPNSTSTKELNDFVYLRYAVDSETGEDCNGKFSKKSQILDYLDDFNPSMIPYTKIVISTFTTQEDVEKVFNNLYKRWNVEFTIDGIVIDIDDIDIRKKLGRDTVGNPRYAVAYKGNFGDIAKVKIQSVNYTLDKDGVINPSVSTDLVMLDGAECGKNIFIDNIKYMKENGIHEGKIVEIKRGGKIIPRIYNPNIDEKISYKSYARMRLLGLLPNVCPSCGCNLNYDESKVDVRCTNNLCSEIVKRRILFFFESMKTKGISEQTVDLMIAETEFYSYFQPSIYHFDLISVLINQSENQFNNYSGFGKRKAEIIFNSIKESITNCTLARLMSATNCFPGLGETKLSWFTESFGLNFDNFMEIMEKKNWTVEEISSTNGYSDISSKIIIDGLLNFYDFFKFNQNIIGNYKSKEIKKEVEINTEKVDMTGKTICFTGFRNPVMEKLILSYGGKIKNSFSLDISILVVKEKGLGTIKEEKAEKKGIKIMDEIEMRDYLSMNTIVEDQQSEIIKKSGETPLW